MLQSIQPAKAYPMARITINPNDRLLTRYYATIKELRETKQDLSEGNTRRAFSTLLAGLGRKRQLTLIEERQMRSKTTGGANLWSQHRRLYSLLQN